MYMYMYMYITHGIVGVLCSNMMYVHQYMLSPILFFNACVSEPGGVDEEVGQQVHHEKVL